MALYHAFRVVDHEYHEAVYLAESPEALINHFENQANPLKKPKDTEHIGDLTIDDGLVSLITHDRTNSPISMILI